MLKSLFYISWNFKINYSNGKPMKTLTGNMPFRSAHCNCYSWLVIFVGLKMPTRLVNDTHECPDGPWRHDFGFYMWSLDRSFLPYCAYWLPWTKKLGFVMPFHHVIPAQEPADQGLNLPKHWVKINLPPFKLWMSSVMSQWWENKLIKHII